MRGQGYKWRCMYCGNKWTRCQRGQPVTCPKCNGKKEDKVSLLGKMVKAFVSHDRTIEYQGRGLVTWRERAGVGRNPRKRKRGRFEKVKLNQFRVMADKIKFEL